MFKGLRVRQTVRIGRGLRVNMSKSGVTYTVGRAGRCVNINPRTGNMFATIGAPGSGMRYTMPVKPEHKGLALLLALVAAMF